MIWQNGIVPEGGPAFAPELTANLLDFGYGVLSLALELRDANVMREGATRFQTNDALELAAEALESAVRRGNQFNGDHGRHLVVSAAAFHLAGFSARAFSLLPARALESNLASAELSLALLLKRDLVSLRRLIFNWLSDSKHSDDSVANLLADENSEFGTEDAVFVALNSGYLRSLALADGAILRGDTERYQSAMRGLRQTVEKAVGVGNIPIWWAATLASHLLRDLWDHSLHIRLPKGPKTNLPDRWDILRRDFIAQLAGRRTPHVDLWPSQLEAAERSIDTRDDLVIALPTSAGKTKIAEFCILRTLADQKRILYITPLRALSAQVERVLAGTFIPLGMSVTSLYGASGYSSLDNNSLVSADIVVATPEKLDFALRQDPQVLDDVGLIVLDEGHMIGLSSREIRYEVLIQRLLRRDDALERRIVCLSAMFNPEDPHFKDFSSWLRNDRPGAPVHVRWRPTRQRLAHLDWQVNLRAGQLSFLEGETAFIRRFVESQAPLSARGKPFPSTEREFCVAAANSFARDGHSVLMYCPQRSLIDPLVNDFIRLHKQGRVLEIKAPDALQLTTAIAIGNEWLGAKHPAVEALRLGVGTHHAALPRPFQSAVEDLLDKKLLPVVVASPTLAQGVDLSCSVLLFRALTRFDAQTNRQKLISPAEFANVIGRAGRAYVDLDGIVVLPTFEAGWARENRQRQFAELIHSSRSQRLTSGLAHLVFEISGIICGKLGLQLSDFLEYVLNNGQFWTNPKLNEHQADEDEVDFSSRSLDEYIADLDVSILSLVDDLDADPAYLATLLDSILANSLWRRTLAREDEATRTLGRALLVSRANWLWENTTVDARRACFAAGLGESAGGFLHAHIDDFVAMLGQMHSAVIRGDAAELSTLSIGFTREVMQERFFSVRKPPNDWEHVLSNWVSGISFADILAGRKVRDEQSTQAFVQDGVVFRLVWAAEAVRVQAVSLGHPQSSELGQGPMLALTYGVPSIPAAILCQAGYASRVGALWVTRELAASFIDLDGMRTWIRAHDGLLSDPDFWPRPQDHLLWNHGLRQTRSDFPRPWDRRNIVVVVQWLRQAPRPGTQVRLIAAGQQSASVCSEDLSLLGRCQLTFSLATAALDGVVRSDGSVIAFYFGPN